MGNDGLPYGAKLVLRTEHFTRKGDGFVKWEKGLYGPDMTRVSFVDRDNGEILDEVDFTDQLWAAAFVHGMESMWYAIAEEHIVKEPAA